MTWTYSGNPTTSVNDQVRFEIQDTDSGAPLLQDAEIAYAVVQESGAGPAYTDGDVLRAAARCCEVLARKFAMQADQVVGSLTTTYSAMAKNYTAEAQRLRKKASGMNAPWAGGQSWDAKAADREDPDQVNGRFERGMFRMPYTGPGDGGIGPGFGPVIDE